MTCTVLPGALRLALLATLFAAGAEAQAPLERAPATRLPAAPSPSASPAEPDDAVRAMPALEGARAGTRLVAANPNGVQFEVRVPAADLEPLQAPGDYRSLTIDGYDTAAVPGDPAVPRRRVFVAVPASGDVRVRAMGLEPVRFGAVRLAPQPGASEASPETPLYAARPEAYASGADVAPERVRLVGVSWMRDQRVAEIEVLPVSYVPASGALTAFGRIAVSVECDGAASPPAPVFAPADPFERVYAATLVNYEQGRSWRRARGTGRSAGASGVRSVEVVPDTSVFAGRTWVKLSIPATGFYRVSYAQLRLLPEFEGLTDTPLDSLRMFTWPGFPVLPEDSYCDSCEFREVAISVTDGAAGDGAFDDNDDVIEFFAMGPSDWADFYDPSRPDTVFINHPYETRNYYYLTVASAGLPVGGTRRRYGMRSGQVVNGAAPTPLTFDARRHLEQDLEYFADPNPRIGFADRNTLFWEKWYWRSLSQGQSFSTSFDLPGADAAQATRVRTSIWGLTYGPIFPACPTGDHTATVAFNATASSTESWRFNTGHVFDAPLAPGILGETGNVLQFDAVPLACGGYSHRAALAWCDVFYQRRFEVTADTATVAPPLSLLTFDGPSTPGDYVYRITGFALPTPPRVIDVTDAYAPVEITDLEYAADGAGYTLRFESVEPGRRRYRIVRGANMQTLPGTSVRSALATSTENLRSATLGADYLVIYYDGFKQAADSLLVWRQSHLPLAGSAPPYETLGVPISAIYDQFSGGRTDPAAIRNFLRAAWTTWHKVPAFVTFLGDASYDFKNYLGRAPAGEPGTLVPSFENGFDSFTQVMRQYATDDWLLNVDNAAQIIPDFFGGRIPAGDLNAANTYVRQKVLAYERSALYGAYRNRVMLIADDDMQGLPANLNDPDECKRYEDALGWEHVRQTAQLDTGFTAPHIDRDYVYLHKYPYGAGATKPGAKDDIISGINEGVTIVNYVGHGSPFKMADESVFLDTDTGALTNTGRLTVFVAASCDIGKFNDPTVPSIGERLVLEPNRGAVGVISATELALSNQNAQLNRVLYGGLFHRDALGGPYAMGFSEALLAAKLGATTTQKYQLMGDAALKPNFAHLWADFTLWDSAGTTPVTEAVGGQTVTLRGQVLDWPGGPPVSFDGVGSLLIEDAAPYERTPPCTCNPLCSGRPFYFYTAAPMFRGDVAIRGGTFESRFIVPLEGKAGAQGRVRMYFDGRASGAAAVTDGVGSRRLQVSPGVNPGGDAEGPRITLSFPGGATSVKPDAVLSISLSDPSGILITGHTLQNGIIVTVDDNTTARVDVTPSFRYAADSYQDGTASFTLPHLSPGAHKVKVSAADNLAAGLDASLHRSSAELAFEVQESPPLRIARTYLFPNPIRSGGAGSGGQFVVDTPGDSVNVLIRIYTASGRQVKALRAFGGLGQVQLPWDGRDSEGYELANGVYFYKVHVNPVGEGGESDASRKATAEGRIVVVGH